MAMIAVFFCPTKARSSNHHPQLDATAVGQAQDRDGRDQRQQQDQTDQVLEVVDRFRDFNKQLEKSHGDTSASYLPGVGPRRFVANFSRLSGSAVGAPGRRLGALGCGGGAAGGGGGGQRRDGRGEA